MDSTLEAAIISASVSAAVSVAVALVSPPITHFLWKRQKRKEQQLATAQRFASVFSEFVALAQFDMRDASWDSAGVARFETVRAEFHGILYSIFVLFDSDVCKKRAEDLMFAKKVGTIECAELQSFLFAEALDRSTKKIPTTGRRPDRLDP